ncbi:MAG: ATP synthase F0 subunit C [Candidatus Aureabacteria bacterium]|nr:ATP synthase F0 subunit C [Candidatus Auribacterota bacterium]
MKRNTLSIGLLMLLAGIAYSESETAQTAGKVILAPGSAEYFSKSVMMAALGLAIVGAMGAFGQSWAIQRALEGMARQPEAGGKLQISMIIGLAFIESLVLFMFLVCFMILYMNPFAKYFVQVA